MTRVSPVRGRTAIDLLRLDHPLLAPYRLKDLRLPNRVVIAPPVTRAPATPDGVPRSSAATYDAQRASAGLIVTEGIQPSLGQREATGWSPRVRGGTEGWRLILAGGERRAA